MKAPHSTSAPGEEPNAPASGLSVTVSLSRPTVLPHVHEAEPLYVLLRVQSSGVHLNTEHPDAVRPPLRLGLILDASGSMHRIVLEARERDHWRQVGEERGELKRGRVDGREGWLWSGRTLAELQAQHRTPMQAALRALVRAGERLRSDDGLQVIAFADRAREFVAAESPDRPAQIRQAVTLLSQGVEASGLGDGTRLADALRLALEGANRGSGVQAFRCSGVQVLGRSDDGGLFDPSSRNTEHLNTRTPERLNAGTARLLLISDGLLEDRVACGAWVERIAEAGIPLCCIGVGDQFDEEWLMGAADATRGRFRYAATGDALEAAVAEELACLETLAARRLSLELRPLGGALFHDLCQVAPEVSAFQRMETDGTVYHFALGDFAVEQEALFLAELALPALSRGRHPILSAVITGETPAGEPLAGPPIAAEVLATPDLDSRGCDPEDLEAIAAVHAYRAERRAQRALRRGELREATRHLRDTRQIVERLGRIELAADLAAQADAMEAGARLSSEGVKRIKAGTRRLMGDE